MDNSYFAKIKKYLDILGIPYDSDFSVGDIQSLYRAKSKILHPDAQKVKNANAKFIELKEAADYLEKNINEVKKAIRQNMAYFQRNSNQRESYQYYENIRREEERKAEQQRQEAERRRQEELKRQAEQKRQEELRKQEEERRRQEELKRQQEKKKQKEFNNRKQEVLEQLKDLSDTSRKDEYLEKDYLYITKIINELVNSINKDKISDIDNLNQKYDSTVNTIKKVKTIKQRKRIKKYSIISASFAFVSLLIIFIVFFSIKDNKYNRAISLFNEGKYGESAELFADVGNYKDSERNLSLAFGFKKLEQQKLEEGLAYLETEGINIKIYNNGEIAGNSFNDLPELKVKVGFERPTWVVVNYDKIVEKQEIYVKINIIANYELVNYEIKLNFNEGNNVVNKTIYYNSGESISIPNPARIGYSFLGWTWNGQGLPQKDVVFGETTLNYGNYELKAQWKKMAYSIEYVMDGGKNHSANPSGYDIDSGIITLYNPKSREGYDFIGWYDKREGGTRILTIDSSTLKPYVLYALWLPENYNITFNYNYDNKTSQISMEYGSSYEGILPTPSAREGYKFIGWFDNISCKGNSIT